MSGEIYIGDRHFSLFTRGELGYLYDMSPSVVAKRLTKVQKRSQEEVARQLAQWQRHLRVNGAPVSLERASPSPQLSSKAQTCEEKTRFMSGLDEADGYPQPAHLRSYIAELRATVKAEMLQLKC